MKKIEEKTDEELVRFVQEKKTDVFSIIVKRYEDKLLRYGKRFLFNYENIEDAVQDVFIKAYINIQSFDTSKKFSSWIYRIAHNHFVNIIKKSKKEPYLFFDANVIFSFADKGNALEDIQEKEEKKELGRYLNKLKVKYREPLILYYFENKNYQEISDILRMPTSTVGIRLKRGRKEIKKLYEKRK
jgi:RNA polymerase sigma-70 factor, ECF subfamily